MSVRTKIVATLGPASDSPERIRELIRAGVDVFRINFSHGSAAGRTRQLAAIRQVEAELQTPMAVLADLCGPKIRVRPVAGGRIELVTGAVVTIQRGSAEGTAEAITTTLDELVDALRPGDPVLLDDGKLRLQVLDRTSDRARCRVVHGGPLCTGKGINLPGTELPISTLTRKDRRDAAWLASRGFDYVALSFVRRADDIRTLRELLVRGGCDAGVIAKVEKPEAVARIEEIVEEADAVMVARGDLGVEMELPEVPAAQKRITALCLERGKPCIVATQMLESMTTEPRPTRAEVSDVANAVLDGADAVMLSGETAVGAWPVEAVLMMNRIVERADSMARAHHTPISCAHRPTTAAMARAVKAVVEAEEIAAVGVFTATGTTARMLCKLRLGLPVLGLSPDPGAVRRMCLFYGVEPLLAEVPSHTSQVLERVAREALERGFAEPGQRIVVLSGRPIGEPGATNTLVVHRVPERLP